jgi:hypothetical protein
MVEITARPALEGGHALRGLLTFVRSQELMAEAHRLDVQELLRDAARLTAPRWRDAPQAEGGVDRIVAKPYRIAELRQVADDVAAATATE